jgi:SAM-dependent methyltransferase
MKLEELGIFEWGALAGALAAAAQSGLLEELVSAHTALPSTTLSGRAGCDSAAVDHVLHLLACTGLVVEEAGRTWRLSAHARDTLARAPGGVEALTSLYGHTPRFVTEGIRWTRADGDARERAGTYLAAVDGLATLFAPAARVLAQALPPSSGPVLDVGAGSGVWSLAMLEHDPLARVTALDLETVLPRFYARAVRLGVAARVDAIAGEYLQVALPRAAYARVVLANVLHLEGEAGAATLVARAAEALAPGGRLVVVDIWDGGTPRQHLAHAAYSLHLAMRTRWGKAHSRAKIGAWISATGLAVEHDLDLHEASPGLSALWSVAR